MSKISTQMSPVYGVNITMTEDEIIAAAKKILNRRVANRRLISKADDMRDWLMVNLAQCDRECFYIILLDTQHRIIDKVCLFTGTIDSAAVYPRDVIKCVCWITTPVLLSWHTITHQVLLILVYLISTSQKKLDLY